LVEHVLVDVRDEGPGIPPQARERCSSVSTRCARRARISGAFGLGLAIARTIVEAHDGSDRPRSPARRTRGEAGADHHEAEE
jgi:two-component system sensor histidine kinase ChvG